MFELRDPSGAVGRRIIMALGGIYVVAGSGISFTNVATDWTLGLDLTVFTLVAGPGLVTLYVGYWLPRSEVRTELFSLIAKWCLGGIGMMLGIFLFIYLVTTNAASVGSMLILTSLSCLSGLGMGYNGAQAGTRALNADEQRREAERYSKELQRYETIVETVNDGIFVIDEDDYFIHVNDAYAEIVGYDREELLGSHTSLVVVKGLNDLSNELQDELLADDGEPKTYDAILETSSGDRIDVEATVASLPKQAANGRDIVGVVRDVTERNERERQLERQNQRLDSFASMVAHELRNPLMIGQMYCNELPADAAPVAVEYITESFDRIDDIIDVLLVVTQGYETVPESTPVRLGDVARNAWNKVDSLRRDIGGADGRDGFRGRDVRRTSVQKPVRERRRTRRGGRHHHRRRTPDRILHRRQRTGHPGRRPRNRLRDGLHDRVRERRNGVGARVRSRVGDRVRLELFADRQHRRRRTVRVYGRHRGEKPRLRLRLPRPFPHSRPFSISRPRFPSPISRHKLYAGVRTGRT